MTCTLYTSQYRSRSNETSTCEYYLTRKHISIEVKITYYFFHANKLHSNDTNYSSCENKDMNTIILTLSLHKLPQYIKVNETVIEFSQYISRINEMLLCILKINDFHAKHFVVFDRSS